MNLQALRVVFVDDELAIRMAVQRVLRSAGMQVELFACAEECLAALPQQACDVVIADLRLNGMDGLSFLGEIKRCFPWLPVIIVTAYGDTASAVKAMKAGAADFLQKPLDRQELLSAIEDVRRSAVPPVVFPREGLSHVEADVLHFVLDGKTSRETAAALNRSIRTIESHRHRIMRKFGVHNAAQLAQRVNTLKWDERSRNQTVNGQEDQRGYSKVG